MTEQGIGARLIRKEDDRYMRGRGQYVGDIRIAGMQEVAFLRSPLAHARIRQIKIPPALRERVFIAEDLAGVAAIRADTSLPGFKSSVQPILATAKVRYVGELVAMCVAPTRAEAEDMLSEIDIDFDPLPAVTDMGALGLACRWCTSTGNNLSHHLDGGEFRGRQGQGRPVRHARAAHRAAGDEPDRGSRRRRHLELAAGPAHRHHLHPAAPHRSLGPRGMPRHR
jgi:CO/xanthine dehydrogenase Mo-binding subunit